MNSKNKMAAILRSIDLKIVLHLNQISNLWIFFLQTFIRAKTTLSIKKNDADSPKTKWRPFQLDIFRFFQMQTLTSFLEWQLSIKRQFLQLVLSSWI